MKKIIAAIAALSMVSAFCPEASFAQSEVNTEMTEWKYGLGSDKGFNEDTYTTITRNEYSRNNVNQWRDGSMTGNGTMGVIESCDPAEDVFIFNNTKFVLATNEVREVADVSANLETIRKNVVNQSSQGAWTGWVTDWRSENYGSNGLSTNTFMYHPAAELRVKNNAYSSNDMYNRYTNWETGELGMQWKKDGAEYNSRTFVSRPDNIAVTMIEAPEGGELDLTLSVDNILEMNIDSAGLINKGIVEAPESKEIITKDALGKTLRVYARTPDGSFTSQSIDVKVSAHETITLSREFESYDYGFGNYKLESGFAYSNSGAVGTINGQAVIKFSDVDLGGLLSITVERNSHVQAAKLTAYYDLEENIADVNLYWDDYNRDDRRRQGDILAYPGANGK